MFSVVSPRPLPLPFIAAAQRTGTTHVHGQNAEPQRGAETPSKMKNTGLFVVLKQAAEEARARRQDQLVRVHPLRAHPQVKNRNS